MGLERRGCASIAGPTDYEILIPEPDNSSFANLHGDALWLPFGSARAGRPSKGGKPWIKSQLPHFPLTATPARRPPDRSARAQRSGRGNGAARGMDERSLSLSTGTSVIAGFSLVYLGLNLIFAALYLLGDGAVANARPGMFADAFFFSVETLSTIGYGQMSPATFYGNAVMTVEAATGVMLIAVAAGLMFARFSRPTALVVFSKVAVVGPFNGVPTLSLRLANERRNQILEAQVSLTLVRDEQTGEGDWIRRFYDLNLARQRSPIFAMTFTVMHPIDANSPLRNATPSSLAAEGAEVVVTVTGIDETTSQMIHARTSYLADEICWNRRFADVFTQTQDGRLAIDYRRFHDTAALGAAPA